MNRNVAYDSKQEASDGTTATVSNASAAVQAAAPRAMEYEAWRVMLRSVCGRYSPEGVEPNAFVRSIRL
jgi:hypothetical protein